MAQLKAVWHNPGSPGSRTFLCLWNGMAGIVALGLVHPHDIVSLGGGLAISTARVDNMGTNYR